MQVAVSTEQLKFYFSNGYLELENVLTQEEAARLLRAIANVRKESPGYPEDHLARSIPMITTLARKRNWGQIAFELVKKKPLRIAYDHFYPQFPLSLPEIPEEACGMLINLESKSALFFQDPNRLPPLYNSSASCYLFLIITAMHLPEKTHPAIFR